jgi:transcriptional regulator with XRE-family HTH domain
VARALHHFDHAGFRAKRISAGFTQEKLARAVDRSLAVIRAYESGRCTPSAAMLAELAELLGIPMDSLFIREAA